MKKIFLSLLIVTLIASPIYAATATTTPTLYEITVTRIEIRNASTLAWTTLGTGSQAFNIASINVGEAVGNFISNADVEPGTYDALRVTLSRNIGVTAQTSVSGTPYYTTATQYDNFGDPSEIQGKGIVISSAVSSPSKGTFQVPDEAPSGAPAGYSQSIDVGSNTLICTMAGAAFGSPITIQQGVPTTLRITFDVTNAAIFEDDFDNGNPGDPTPVGYIDPPLIEVTTI